MADRVRIPVERRKLVATPRHSEGPETWWLVPKWQVLVPIYKSVRHEVINHVYANSLFEIRKC